MTIRHYTHKIGQYSIQFRACNISGPLSGFAEQGWEAAGGSMTSPQTALSCVWGGRCPQPLPPSHSGPGRPARASGEGRAARAPSPPAATGGPPRRTETAGGTEGGGRGVLRATALSNLLPGGCPGPAAPFSWQEGASPRSFCGFRGTSPPPPPGCERLKDFFFCGFLTKNGLPVLLPTAAFLHVLPASCKKIYSGLVVSCQHFHIRNVCKGRVKVVLTEIKQKQNKNKQTKKKTPRRKEIAHKILWGNRPGLGRDFVLHGRREQSL